MKQFFVFLFVITTATMQAHSLAAENSHTLNGPFTVSGYIYDPGTASGNVRYISVSLNRCEASENMLNSGCFVEQYMTIDTFHEGNSFSIEGESAGSYILVVGAPNYQDRVIEFTAKNGDKIDLGVIEMRPHQVFVPLGIPCFDVTDEGGTCEFSAFVVNNRNWLAIVKVDAIVEMFVNGGWSSRTVSLGKQHVRLLPGQSEMVTFHFSVNEKVPSGSFFFISLEISPALENSEFVRVHQVPFFTVTKIPSSSIFFRGKNSSKYSLSSPPEVIDLLQRDPRKIMRKSRPATR